MIPIKKMTIIRTIILALALINQTLTGMGKPIIPLEDETLTEFLTNVFTIVSALWAWWKNNSFTTEAIIADEELAEMKSRRY